ncbi:IclR family transcriptional regulator [Pseudacidovorax intermedius]|uniref:IclR family transcriptional regulator n=1 Tax=Pseudacidovorax intermedius TaxID=433924 RepID=A0A147H7M2_9BURK|nr:IclR family transcriptional regulator [Pseudacidovorax intermedius]KTT25885.1 IclR family transcriptional regulator [Pseudacidovorax intermedius]
MPRRTSSSPAAGADGHVHSAPEPVSTRARERRQRVQSAETGMAVLKGLARLGGRASLTALATHMGESPAKVHRYLASLVEEELVTQDSGSQHYHLGPAAIQIGVAAMRQADPLRLAEPALVRLRESLEVTCFLAVMGNKGPTIVRFEEPGLPITVNVRVGSVLPLLWSATGRAFLGWLGDETRVRALADEELAAAGAARRASLDGAAPIDRLCAAVRAAGCAWVRDTNLPGISAIAAPLFDHAGRVRAVITALGATGGFDPDPDGAIGRAVRQAAQAASRQLGEERPPPARPSTPA